MANPQPDQFTRISNELYEAIMQADFTKRQRNILDLVIRMSYGCGKKSALLKRSDFELVGVHKSDIGKELDYLAAANVLVIDGDRIMLNKNYDQWRISLVKGAANRKRFEEVLLRNLQDRTNQVDSAGSEKVGKIPTQPEGQVGILPTQDERPGWYFTNQGVGNLPTEQAEKVGILPTKTPDEPLSDAASGPRKENNVKENVKENMSSPPPPSPTPDGVEEGAGETSGEADKPDKPDKHEPTLEEIFSRYPRYSSEQWTTIREYWDLIRFTRKTGRVAASIVAKEMDYWERFPPDIALMALTIHLRKYQTKQEDYTRGIMRRLQRERERSDKRDGSAVRRAVGANTYADYDALWRGP